MFAIHVGMMNVLFKPSIRFSLRFYRNLDQESNRKRGRREHRNNNRYNQNQLDNPSRRGDISVVYGDCDGKRAAVVGKFIFHFLFSTENLLARMNELIALVKKLEKDISNQHGDVKRLQSLIENCAGC